MTEMSSSLYPLGVKNFFFWTCSGLWDGAIGHVIACHRLILPRSHMQFSANHVSVLVCRDATSSEHQSSSQHPRFVFTVQDYRCQQLARTPIGTKQRRKIWHSAYYAKRISPWYNVVCSRMAYRWIRNSLRSSHVFFCMNMLIILILHPTSGPVGLSGAHLQPRFPYTRESQWQDAQCWIYCCLHLIFPLQEEIFHLEPGKVESGKGKCSYDPKLNSVSALISEYHKGLFVLYIEKGTFPAVLIAMAMTSHMDSFYMIFSLDMIYIFCKLC